MNRNFGLSVKRTLSVVEMPAMAILVLFALLSCSGEWVSAPSLSVCELRDEIPFAHKPKRAVSKNGGDELFILDDFYTLSHYKRVESSVCAYEMLSYDNLNGFPSDISANNSNIFIQDGKTVYSLSGKEYYNANGGAWTVLPNGEVVWASKFSTGAAIIAITADYDSFYAVEAAGNTPQNLAVYSGAGTLLWREPFSQINGNEKNFCSASRLLLSGSALYLLDNKCGKLGVFYTNGTWYKTIDLFSLGISAPLDIVQGEYGGIIVMNDRGIYGVR